MRAAFLRHGASTSLLRRLHWSLLLPFFLLFAQQGQLRHEISHLAVPAKSFSKEARTDKDHCELCLAFGHLAGAARPEVLAPRLLSGLSDGLAAEPAATNVSVAALSPRSRGPPAS